MLQHSFAVKLPKCIFIFSMLNYKTVHKGNTCLDQQVDMLTKKKKMSQ